jgi:hypothetical protein
MLINMNGKYVVADAVKTFLPMEDAKGIQIVWGRAGHAEYDNIFGDFDAVEIRYGNNGTLGIQNFHLIDGIACIDADKKEYGIATFFKANEDTKFWGEE